MEEAEWIRREHEIVICDQAATLARSAGLGEALLRVQNSLKAEFGRGRWTPWVAKNLPEMSMSTVRCYIQIFKRQGEPLAQEDPDVFMAQIYGNLPPEEGTDDAPLPSNQSLTIGSSGAAEKGALPPSKRTRKSTKAKNPPIGDPPPTDTVPGQKSGSVSLETAVALSADALEKALGEWKRASFASLRKAANGNKQLAGGLERLDRDIDALVVRLRGYRALAS